MTNKNEYFASWSGGADSTAQIILALEHGETLTAVVYCEIMFTSEISAEVPEHRDFIYNTAIPWMEAHGLPVIVLRAEKTARDWMMSSVTRGPHKGKAHGFPMVQRLGRCSIKRDCKLPPLEKFGREHPGALYYEGICTDEPKRIKPDKLEQGGYLLVKYGYTQEMARKLCNDMGLLSPIYGFAKRGGCFFCPNAGYEELRHLWEHHRYLWDDLRQICEHPELVRPGKFSIDFGLQDLESSFLVEKCQCILDGFR